MVDFRNAGRVARWSAALLAAAALAGCASGTAGTGPAATGPAATGTAATGTVASGQGAAARSATQAFATVERSATSRIQDARTVVVRDEAAWQALWAEHAGTDRAAPPVDFAKDMVVGVFLGTRPNGCYTVDIVDVGQAGAALRVRAAAKVPGPASICTMMMTAPVHLVATARSALTVEFATETRAPQ